MSKKVALITGITGQDGSYLADFLLEKDYEIHGLVRRSSHFNRHHIESTRELARSRNKIFDLHYGNMDDYVSLIKVIAKCKPTEIYNLAAQSHVRVSFDEPEHAGNVDGIGTLRLLEGMRQTGSDARFYQASTSELFGIAEKAPQNEETPFHPRSPYGVAKLYSYWIVRNYRETYSMHASNGILFNHESPRRGESFVTRKITYSLARIKAGKEECLVLGNLDARRDWGYAKDYVEGMWLMLQQEKPDDYVLATGVTHTVRDFVQIAATVAGFDLEWEGSGSSETAKDRKTGKVIVRVDPKYFRPVEAVPLVGDASKARKVLGWKPKTNFEQLVEMMMLADLKLFNIIT